MGDHMSSEHVIGCVGMRSARAIKLAAYADSGLAEIAAAYAFGICKAHAFVDGNKRTAFVAALTFLRLNGYSFRPQGTTTGAASPHAMTGVQRPSSPPSPSPQLTSSGFEVQ